MINALNNHQSINYLNVEVEGEADAKVVGVCEGLLDEACPLLRDHPDLAEKKSVLSEV